MRDLRENARVIFAILIAILISLFAILNSKPVEISFWFKKIQVSQAVVILISILIGALLMYIMTMITAFRRNARKRKEKKLETKKEKQIKTEVDKVKKELVASKDPINVNSGKLKTSEVSDSEERKIDGYSNMNKVHDSSTSDSKIK